MNSPGANPPSVSMQTLGLDQPLVVERGAATLRLGSGYDLASRGLMFTNREVSLAGLRRLQLSAGYTLPTPAGPLRLATLHDTALGRTGALLSLSSSW